MSRMKDTIPENPVCDNGCSEICLECQYDMETIHINKRFKPSMEDWYDKVKTKKE